MKYMKKKKKKKKKKKTTLVGGGEGVSAVCITIIAKKQYTKVSRKSVTEKFKNKREIGADKGEITQI
jgi:hypothetical protein